MFGFAWMFWLIPFLFFCMMARRWRRKHWALGSVPQLDRRRDYTDSLERRVAELEERLDFTERLLAQRNQPSTGSA
jgi:hypothetical protein